MTRCLGTGIVTEKTDRPCGILTKSQREYLINDELPDYDYAESKKMSQISTRVRHGFHDLMLIQKYGDEDLKRRILNEDNRTDVIGEDTGLLMDSLARFMSELAGGEEFTDWLFLGLEMMESGGEIGYLTDLGEALQNNKDGKALGLFTKFINEETKYDLDMSSRPRR